MSNRQPVAPPLNSDCASRQRIAGCCRPPSGLLHPPPAACPHFPRSENPCSQKCPPESAPYVRPQTESPAHSARARTAGSAKPQYSPAAFPLISCPCAPNPSTDPASASTRPPNSAPVRDPPSDPP